MIKLVKTGPDSLIERSHPEPRTPADRGTNIPRSSRAHHPRPPSPWPSSRTDPGSNNPRSSRSCLATTSRARPRRANREAMSRGRAAHTTSRGRSIRPTRKASSHDRPKIIHPSDPVGRTRKLSATIVPTVPIADHDPIAGRLS
ncbi:unnamed protein product [Microthlaspi erraticum]|uniref:Uncharacterized protein n=1 Tax=Microthlaspi erraticum TaxID=1685480 RepID=A0A6D2IUE6_9BRAS|nr:unnamed protein product [Microthlaspi erraticum]